MVSKAVRDSARGEQCTLNIMGACNHDSATVVLCHLPGEGGGVGIKSDDINACYGCANCHSVIDGRTKWPAGEQTDRDWYLRRAQTRTIKRLFEKGIISIKGVK
ncbi:nuclease domain-containing protein [Carnimonas bestiolae]|uniref:nuclease domain-containing protein n=1 Tax=Carnimonas bestiolae TaxID=3402172 RepID=UPI003EDC8261